MIGVNEGLRPFFLERKREPETIFETRKECLTCDFLQDTRLGFPATQSDAVVEPAQRM
jgi:hypothetical protein